MRKNKLINFIIFIPFAIAIGAFVLYFKYLFMIKGASKVTEIMEVSLVRYRNIGVFCLAIGVFLLFIKTIINYFRIDDEYEVRNENVLDKISSRQENDTKKYSFNENNIINDLLNNQELKAIFYNGNIIEKTVKFKNYDKDDNIIEFYDLSKDKNTKKINKVAESKTIEEPVKNEYVVNKEYDIYNFKKCHKCKNIIARDSIICVHCGTVLKHSKIGDRNNNSLNPIRFVVNLIVILICIILLLLCFNAINNKAKLNKVNLNIQNIKQ